MTRADGADDNHNYGYLDGVDSSNGWCDEDDDSELTILINLFLTRIVTLEAINQLTRLRYFLPLTFAGLGIYYRRPTMSPCH